MTAYASTSLIAGCECRVSSVLNRNTKEVGKQFLFDNDPSSCWNSDQGTPQWVVLRWTQPVTVDYVVAQFQGGFCGGSDTVVEVKKQYTDDTWTRLSPWYLEDSSAEQTLDLASDATTKTTTPSLVGHMGGDYSEKDGAPSLVGHMGGDYSEKDGAQSLVGGDSSEKDNNDSQQSLTAVSGDTVQDDSITARRVNQTNSLYAGATNNIVSLTNKDYYPHKEGICTLRLLFPSSTDFYGRIIMYKLDVLGSKVS